MEKNLQNSIPYMISILLYIFSFLILFLVSLFLHKRIIYKWQQVGLWIHFALLLASAVYHTSTYGKREWRKAHIDQEGFYYYRPSSYRGGYSSYNKGFSFLLKRVFNTVTHYSSTTNTIYPCVYWTMRDHFFEERFFYEGFFLACMLNACLHLIALFLLFKIFNKFSLKDSYKVLGFILFHFRNLLSYSGMQYRQPIVLPFFPLFCFYGLWFVTNPLFISV